MPHPTWSTTRLHALASAGVFKSTYHRVRAPTKGDPTGERYSIPYFVNPRLNYVMQASYFEAGWPQRRPPQFTPKAYSFLLAFKGGLPACLLGGACD